MDMSNKTVHTLTECAAVIHCLHTQLHTYTCNKSMHRWNASAGENGIKCATQRAKKKNPNENMCMQSMVLLDFMMRITKSHRVGVRVREWNVWLLWSTCMLSHAIFKQLLYAFLSISRHLKLFSFPWCLFFSSFLTKAMEFDKL